jgi:acyl-CoA reductase-like NAD-dependent aldehyde dehydrogenase
MIYPITTTSTLSKEAPMAVEARESELIESINPATGEVIGTVPEMTEGEVREAVQRARRAFDTWSSLSFEQRADHILSVCDLMVDRSADIARTISKETGKPIGDAYVAELFTTADLIHFYARKGKKILQPKQVTTGMFLNKKAYKLYQPLGVVAVISPWNYPFSLTMGPVISALFAGNTVVLKPSEFTPFVGKLVGDLFEGVGSHSGIVQVVTGAGKTGEALVRSGVQKVVFTGSVETGRKVMRAAADSLTPVVMELGGKDPMIVLDDADVERAANAAVWGAFSNCGQTCTSIERVYVTEGIYDEFVAKVVEKTKALRVGYSEGDQVFDVGSITRPAQMDVIESHISDAKEKGARILTGGRRIEEKKPGYFYEPTVLVDVDHRMKIMTEETFGPVLPIMKVRNRDEALRLANESRYGLGASVWTKDSKEAERLAEEVKAGGVVVNDCLAHYGVPSLPFGGVKESGIGRTHGAEGLREFCEVKSVLVDRFGPKREFFWYPAPKWLPSALDRGIRLLYRRGLRQKLR